ncbi:MAG: substrate-binding domain-containing protein [Bacteroidales bacterium]|nr:substrate-binding domain-containing protein [Bacteroidales bacterium]
MKKSIFSILALAAAFSVVFSSCGSGNSRKAGKDDLQGEVNISGAFALYPMMLLWAEEFEQMHPGVTINVSGGGAGKGMTDALNGMVDFGMISREIKPSEIEKGAWFIAVACDAVVPTIHPSNPLYSEVLKRGLTRRQLEQIFITGEITRWNQLYPGLAGAPDEAISVYTRSDACGAAETFAGYYGKHQEDLLGIGINGDPGMAAVVQRDVYGIGYNNIGFGYDQQSRKPVEGLGIIPLDQNENGVLDEEEDFYADVDVFSDAVKNNRYPAPPARSLYLAGLGYPQNPAARAFVAYILDQGQALTSAGGYVALPEELRQAQLQKLQPENE